MPPPRTAWPMLLKLTVIETDDCVLWPMSTDSDGYANRVRSPQGRVRPHRFALIRRRLPGGEGMLACHTCHNPRCINYRHLYWGTPVTNYRDSREAGRNLRGEASHCARLSASEVRLIRQQHVFGVSQCALSREFGVSNQMINAIVRHRKWIHVGDGWSEP